VVGQLVPPLHDAVRQFVSPLTTPAVEEPTEFQLVPLKTPIAVVQEDPPEATVGASRKFVGQTKLLLPVESWQILKLITCPKNPLVRVLDVTSPVSVMLNWL
jgi:hypothetical protein